MCKLQKTITVSHAKTGKNAGLGHNLGTVPFTMLHMDRQFLARIAAGAFCSSSACGVADEPEIAMAGRI